MIEYGKYCACIHSLKEKCWIMEEKETISEIDCKFRRKSGYGWQSFCSKEDRLEMSCENENFECGKKGEVGIEKEKKKEELK